MSMRTVTPPLHSAEFQTTTVHIRLPYELPQIPIVRPIPYRVNYSLYFPKLQIVKKLLSFRMIIYMYVFSQNAFFLNIFYFIYKKNKKRESKKTPFFIVEILTYLKPFNFRFLIIKVILFTNDVIKLIRF